MTRQIMKNFVPPKTLKDLLNNPSVLDRNDPVNHPSHYGGKDNPYETIKVINAWKLDFYLGNAVKYISRAGKKESELVDLKKARWYLDCKIELLEKK
jgi:hypothetical protein